MASSSSSSAPPSSLDLPSTSSASSSSAPPAPVPDANSQNSFLAAADMLNLNDEEQENGGGDDGDEYWTTEELLKELTRAFLDEMAAPKLLPEKLEMVDKMMVQMADIEKIIANSSSKGGPIYAAHRMELCRIEHVINSYLRVRLKKVEANPAQALHAHSERLRRAMAAQRAGRPLGNPALLDRREAQFAQRLHAAEGTLLADQFLQHIPANMQFVPVPRQNSAEQTRVFVQVRAENINRVPVPNMADPNSDILVSLDKGTRHLIPFHCVEELLDQGDISLL